MHIHEQLDHLIAEAKREHRSITSFQMTSADKLRLEAEVMQMMPLVKNDRAFGRQIERYRDVPIVVRDGSPTIKAVKAP